MCMWSGKSPDLGNETYVVSYLGRAQAPLNCPASLVLEFQPTGNGYLIALPWGVGGGHLLPASRTSIITPGDSEGQGIRAEVHGDAKSGTQLQ